MGGIESGITLPQIWPIHMDLCGHSLAGEGGADNITYGAFHKLATHLQPASIKSSAMGGCVCGISPEGGTLAPGASGTYGGATRVLIDWPNDNRKTGGAVNAATNTLNRLPFMPLSQLVCIHFGCNDLAWVGPQNLNELKEGLRTCINRFRSAAVFEETQTAAINGSTPWTFYPQTTQNSGGTITLPVTTLTVASNVGFPPTGNITMLRTDGTYVTVSYTGKSSTTGFTGVSGGTGSVAQGAYTSPWLPTTNWGYSSGGGQMHLFNAYSNADSGPVARIQVPPDLRDGGEIIIGWMGGQATAGAAHDIVDVTAANTTSATATTAGTTTSIVVASGTGIYAGLTLTLDSGTNAETVTVAGTYTPGSTTVPFTAAVTKTRSATTYPVSGPGLLQQYDTRNRNGWYFLGTQAASGTYLPLSTRVTLGAQPKTTLAADLIQGQAVGPQLTSANGFAQSGVVLIDGELLTYTSISGNNLAGTISRGVGNAAYGIAHSAGTTVHGVRTIEIRPTAVTVSGTGDYFDYWAIVATPTPVIMLPKQYRCNSYVLWGGWPYPPRERNQLNGAVSVGGGTLTVQNTTTNGAVAIGGDITVTSTAGFPGGGVIVIDSECIFYNNIDATHFLNCSRGTMGTTAATHLTGANVKPAVAINDTITIDPKGANPETFRVTATPAASSNTVSLSGTFAFAHSSGVRVDIGLQDYDVVNYLNPAIDAVVNEYNDPNIFSVDIDSTLAPAFNQPYPGDNFITDGVHPNNRGQSQLTQQYVRALAPRFTNIPQSVASTVPVTKPFYDSTYNQIALLNSWVNYDSGATTGGVASPQYPNLRALLDGVNGNVYIEGTVKNGSSATAIIAQLTFAWRPRVKKPFIAVTLDGPVTGEIDPSGNIYLTQNCNTAFVYFSFNYIAEQ